MYKVLAEAPDPYPLLEATVVRIFKTVYSYTHIDYFRRIKPSRLVNPPKRKRR